MAQDEEVLDPSTTSMAYNLMAPVWQKITDVLGGTTSMRAAGQAHLPEHDNELGSAYSDRLAASTLFNATELTLDSWVGRPFSDPINISEEVTEPIADLLEDVDLQGNAVGVFAREWFKEGISKAFAHILVDFPLTPDGERTLADDRAENLRPYWLLVKPENLIFASATIVEGREVLTHIRIREQITQRVGFSEVTTQRIRVLDRIFPGENPFQILGMDATLAQELIISGQEDGVFFSIWTLMHKEDEEDEWVLTQAPTKADIDEIPLVTFYANREGLMQGNSPIECLADLNIRHWQSTSDQINILTVARFPMLALSGGDEDESIVEIGPKRMLFTPEPTGKFYYVEHTGKAIAAGRQDLMDLEEQMGEYGADFLKKRPGNLTATARALDAAEATSPLQDATIRFNDALAQAKMLTSKWLGVEDDGVIEVSVDFGPEEAISGDLNALKEMRRSRDLNREDYLEEMKRRGVLGDSFDMELNEQRLEEEQSQFTGEATTDIDPLAEE